LTLDVDRATPLMLLRDGDGRADPWSRGLRAAVRRGHDVYPYYSIILYVRERPRPAACTSTSLATGATSTASPATTPCWPRSRIATATARSRTSGRKRSTTSPATSASRLARCRPWSSSLLRASAAKHWSSSSESFCHLVRTRPRARVPSRGGDVHRGRRPDRLHAAARRARLREPHRDGAKFLLIMSPPAHNRYFDELAQILPVDGPPTATRSRNCAAATTPNRSPHSPPAASNRASSPGLRLHPRLRYSRPWER
jgi:hypothetical protein